MIASAPRSLGDEDMLIRAAIGLASNMGTISKGYYDRQSLSQPEREDYNMLRGQGVPDAEAKALAWALNGRGRGKVIGHLKKATGSDTPLSMQQKEAFKAWRAMGFDAPDARRMALSGKMPVGKAADGEYPPTEAVLKLSPDALEALRGAFDLLAPYEDDLGNGLLDDFISAIGTYEDESDRDMWRDKLLLSPAKRKSSVGKAHSDPYLKAFHSVAKEVLPDWLHEKLHVKARGSAGGNGAKVSRIARSSESKAEQLADIAYIKEFLKELEDEVVAKADEALVQVAAVATPNTPGTTNAAMPAPLDAIAFLQANKLIAGMDAEMLSGAGDANVARDRASRMMLERPGYYDAVADEPHLRFLGGLDVDLGSGNSRSMGFLGIDLYPYDYGTILHDLDMGIPLPDGSVRSLHARNLLEQMFGANGDPTPLLMEAQRVLMEGGELLYEGGQPLMAEGSTMPTPGLELSTSSPRQMPGQPVRQIFKRVPIAVPAYHGAVAPFHATDLTGLSVDDQLALRQHNEAPAEVAMANLVHKRDMHKPGDLGGHTPPPLTKAAIRKGLGNEKVAAIFKSDDWRQIVYGVVLAPNELDSQNDWMTPADIEEAAHHYLATSRVVGTEHTDPIAAVPVESFIAPQDLDFNGQYGPTKVTKGSWILGVKINDADQWARVLAGEYTGFSVGGFGIRE